MPEIDVKWRAWAYYDRPGDGHQLRESRAVVEQPTGSEIAACVVWQEAANNDQCRSLWLEEAVIVEIVEPVEYAGHYEVAIEIKCTTTGREMTTDEVRAEYAEAE